jgi:drug/metabolite transporter (DMT)-like permease
MPASAATPSRPALIGAFATIYLVWGSTYLGMHIAVETMPPFLMAAARFLVAGALLFTFLKLRGAPTPSLRQWRVNTLIGAFLLLGGNGAVVWASQYLPSGIIALLIGIGPLFIVLTEWAWPGGLRPTARTFGAMLLGFTGVVWLAAPWQNTAHGGLHLGGVIAILIGCVAWALGSITSRHAQHGATPAQAAALQMLGGGAALLVAAGLHGDFARFDVHAVSPRSWLAFVYLVGIGSLVGYSTFVWLMKNCAPAHVATYGYVNPIVAVFLGWLILDEPISTRTLIASAIIITSVVLITLEKSKPAENPLRKVSHNR